MYYINTFYLVFIYSNLRMSTEITLGKPNIGRFFKYLGETIILTTSIATVIMYKTSFDLNIEMFQQFLTWIVLESMIFLLNTYHNYMRFKHCNRVFASFHELNSWYNSTFHRRIELLMYLTSLIIRFSFIQFLYNPPKDFKPQQLQIYVMIYIVSIWTYASLFSVVGSFLAHVCFLGVRRRPIQNYYWISVISNNSLRNRVANFIPNNLEEHVDETCPICLETGQEPWVELICHHKFHRHCIHQYITGTVYIPTCPMCRGPIQQEAQTNMDLIAAV
jgi:hypothetical protein